MYIYTYVSSSSKMIVETFIALGSEYFLIRSVISGVGKTCYVFIRRTYDPEDRKRYIKIP